jgi:hypothetical protein
MMSNTELIYRITGTNTAKSLSLHKVGDYETGLSFLDYDIGGRTIKFRLDRLKENGYRFKFDGDQPMINVWTGEPYFEPNSGLHLNFPAGHVSIWHENHNYWYEWHLADKANYGIPDISLPLQKFFDLREE